MKDLLLLEVLTFFLKDKPEEMKKMKENLEKHAEKLSEKIKSK